ncbi:hypothetical protein FRC10_011990 [Ceratobasidium sp. 414]|nr:hypothetical protein FRC10_011990 [Ceratobasidium sp. 414]
MCKNAGIELDPIVLAMKVEEEDADLPKEEHVKEPTEDPLNARSCSSYSTPTISFEIAKYIAKGVAGHFLTSITDWFFANPTHTLCYEIGGCLNCVRCQAVEEPDKHQQEQLDYAYKVTELPMELEDVKMVHKKPTTFQVGAEPQLFRQPKIGDYDDLGFLGPPTSQKETPPNFQYGLT